MIWNTFKFLISTICLGVATLIIVLEPINFGTFGFAIFFTFLAAMLWIDFTKSQDSQKMSNAHRKLAKIVIWGLVAILVLLFVNSLFSSDGHINAKGLFKIVMALLQAL